MRKLERKEIYKLLRESIIDENGKPLGVNKLAKKLNIASSRISELENGKREMSLTELKAYHDFFDASFEYLLGETEFKSSNMIEVSISERTGLSEEAISAIQQTVYEEGLSELLETELVEGGVISLILEYITTAPLYWKRLIVSKNGEMRFDESEEMCDYNGCLDMAEISTDELYKTVMFNKILSRISYIKNNSFEKIKKDNKAIQKWQEVNRKIMIENEVFSQTHTVTPFEETDLYKELNEHIEKEAADNGNHNPEDE